MEFLLLIGAIFATFFGLDWLLRKLFRAERVNLTETPAKQINRWGRGIILVIALCSFPFTIGTGTFNGLLWFWIIYLISLNGFEAYLQWKYARESKEHLVTLSLLPVGIGMLFVIAYFF